MALLEAKNLSITFGGLKAVDDFNIESVDLQNTSRQYDSKRVTRQMIVYQINRSIDCPVLQQHEHLGFNPAGKTHVKRQYQ